MEQLFTIHHLLFTYPLPLVMRKRLVCISHAVGVFLLLHRITPVVGGVEDFCRQTISHCLFAPSARVGNNPTNRQRSAPFLMNFDWYLIRRTANATRLYFHGRFDVVYSPFENLQRLFAGLITNLPHRSVKNILRQRLLPHPHHAVDELRDQRTAVNRVRQNFSSFGNSSSWHNRSGFRYQGSRISCFTCRQLFETISFQRLLSVASLRTLNDPVCDPRRQQNQAFRE